MIVFAFDRDQTVDVNPHAEKEAVPLEWVKHLATETEHEVWTIGNQTLTEEARIPGMNECVERLRKRAERNGTTDDEFED